MLAGLRFAGAWRHYQELALDAFEADRAARAPQHAPRRPARLGQDPARLRDPPPDRRAGARARAELGDPGAVGRRRRGVRRARGVWSPPRPAPPSPASPTRRSRGSTTRAPRCAAPPRRAGSPERAAATAEPEPRGGRRRGRARGRARPRARRDARARADHRVAQARDRARRRRGGRGSRTCSRPAPASASTRCAPAACGTVVLDECHHLASLWGYVVRAVLEELGGDVHVVGLTATPPDELTTQEAELYAALLGPVDFQVPTPGRRPRRLPRPVPGARLADRAADRRAALARRARDALPRARHGAARRRRGRAARPRPVGRHPAAAPRPRRRRRGRGAVERLPAPPARRSPRAGVRFLGSAGLPLPPGAPRGEAYRRPPDLDDWVVLLEDWVLRCLDAAPPRPRPRAARRSPPRCATSATR